jgi:tetratricopeptide (TPR) repeat protein
MTDPNERPQHAPQSSWLQQIRRRLWRTNADRLHELNDLSEAIERDPAEAVHYLLRAGVHVELRQYQHAKDDYERALDLAENALAAADWGFSAQVIRDKALRGLRQMQRYVE